MSKLMQQVKFTIDADTVAAFKAQCLSKGVSMASEVSNFMKSARPTNSIKVNTITRSDRKKAVLVVLDMLNNIMEAEMAYRDLIPEKFTSRYEVADLACEQLEQAISYLQDAF